jgi:hypothetical protein
MAGSDQSARATLVGLTTLAIFGAGVPGLITASDAGAAATPTPPASRDDPLVVHMLVARTLHDDGVPYLLAPSGCHCTGA